MRNSCDKAAVICSKTQYREATFVEKIKLQLHILVCNTCKKFTKQNAELTSLCNKAHLHSLSEEEKVKMKDHLGQLN
ncbi:MAG: hypothetical protein WBM83_08580 [Flavobacteriaceae bacterium]